MTSFPVVIKRTIGGDIVQSVNARDLHAFLGNKDHFSTWIKDRIVQYNFTLDSDFVTYSESSEKGRPSLEYVISIDMAKEISMVERSAGARKRGNISSNANAALKTHQSHSMIRLIFAHCSWTTSRRSSR